MKRDTENRNDDHEQLRQELLELHFGCHENPDELEARLAQDPELQALYLEVQQMADLLQEAATEKVPELELVVPGEEKATREPSPGPAPKPSKHSGLHFGRGFFAAAAALVLICLTPVSIWGWNSWTIHELRSENLRVVLSAPPAVPDGAPMRFHIETRDLGNQQVPCDIEWEVLDARNNTTLARDAGSCKGAMHVDVAGSLAGPGPRLIQVTATRPGTDEKQVARLPIHRIGAAPMVHLTSDKPAYRPGEPVFLRAAVLDRLTLKPRPFQVLRYRITNPRGAVVQQIAARVGMGVLSTSWRVPPDAAGGEYAFEARDPKDQYTIESLPIFVRRFQPPKLKKDITLDQKTYTAGTSGIAEVKVSRVAGGNPNGARCVGSVVVDGKQTWQQEGRLDAEGRCVFRFPVPTKVDKGAGRFVAKVTDSGVIETELKAFVVPTEKLNIVFSPEGGKLVPGVRNRVYAQVEDALGRPITARGTVVDARGRKVCDFRTHHQGRALFAFQPSAGTQYTLRLEEPYLKSIPLPKPDHQGVALTARRAVFPAGKPIDVQVHTPNAGPWVVAVFCRGVSVGQENLHTAGTSNLSIKVLPEAWGVLRITVFDREMKPVAERLVQRDTDRRLRITMTSDKPKLAPGQKQKVTFKTTDEKGEAVAAVLGVSVTDKSVSDMLDDTRIGLVDQAKLLGDVDRSQLDDLDEFLHRKKKEQADRNVDLLLGSLCWRRFAWQGKAEEKTLVAAGGDWAKSLPAKEGAGLALNVRDVHKNVKPQIQTALRRVRHARNRAGDLSVMCLIVLGLMVAGKLFWWLTSKAPSHRVRPIRNTALVATGATVLLMLSVTAFWMTSELSRPGAELMDFLGVDTAPKSDSTFAPRMIESETGIAYIRDFDVEIAQASVLAVPQGLEGDGVVRPSGFADFGLFASVSVDSVGRPNMRWPDFGDLLGYRNPSANPAPGYFYDDGKDGDLRGLTENLFDRALGAVLLPRISDIPAHAEVDGFWRYQPMDAYRHAEPGRGGAGDKKFFEYYGVGGGSAGGGRQPASGELALGLRGLASFGRYVEHNRLDDGRREAMAQAVTRMIGESRRKSLSAGYTASALQAQETGNLAVSYNLMLAAQQLAPGNQDLQKRVIALRENLGLQPYKVQDFGKFLKDMHRVSDARAHGEVNSLLQSGLEAAQAGNLPLAIQHYNNALLTIETRPEVEWGDIRARTDELLAKARDRASAAELEKLGTEQKAAREKKLAELGELWKNIDRTRWEHLRAVAEVRYGKFAYQHKASATGTRRNFIETVYWNPFLLTDNNGEASIEFDVADSVTTWKVYTDGFTGTGRIGQAEGDFVAELPFHMDAKVPVEITLGDKVQVPVSIVCSDSNQKNAMLMFQSAGPLAFGAAIQAGNQNLVKLNQGRGRFLVPFSCTSTTSPAMLAVQGNVLAANDKFARQIQIVPKGFPKNLTRSGKVAEQVEVKVALPEDLVAGSGKAMLKLYPSPLSTIQGGLEGIVREPHGCFEQTSSSNYPNVMVLSYLQASGDNIPSLASKARRMLPRGYNKLVGYECGKHGYEWWGKDPGHAALTGYGLMQFSDMAKVFDVDQKMLDRTRGWVMDKRDGKGGFRPDNNGHSFGRAPQPVVNAYLAWSLASTGTKAEDIQLELDTLETRSKASKDPYELALIANALRDGGRNEAAKLVRKKLVQAQQKDGSLEGTTTSITCSGGRDLVVETTSLAILAWAGDEAMTGPVHKGIDYLMTARKGSGSFGATQATILALKALTAAAGGRQTVDGVAKVWINGSLVATQPFSKGQVKAIEFAGLFPKLRKGENDIRIGLSGGNELPFTFDLAYHADQPADDPECRVALETFLSKRNVAEGDTVALTVRVQNRQPDKPLPMTMAIVGLPASLHVSKEVLDDLKKGEQFDFYELQGRDLVLYWRGLEKGQQRQVVLDLTARIPGTTTGPASRAYLYYTPDQKRWARPLTVQVRPGR